ncbi:MAG: phenylacetate--CoA ligase family protein, partial [Candidatus Accumulibacter sp.]|nr:phenylacetate--CoA ligase family protein [Accumulibacter sp.]
MNYYDSLETRSPVEREAWLMARLPQQVAHAKRKSAYWRRLLDGVAAESIDSRAALAALPLTRKSELSELQRAAPPFGGLTATPMTGLSRVFASPGPIYDPEGRGEDWWRFARVLFAAGFRAGDLVHNAFSYHFTPAGFMLEGAAQKLGCPVFPAGVGQTDMQVQAMADLRPAAYVGTPSFLRIIL